MKKVLCMLLCLCMMISIFTAIPASAATILSVYKVTIDEPKIGSPLPVNAVLPQNASTYVTSVEWKGNLDENGNAKEGEKYTVYVTVRVKDTETNKFIVEQKGKPTVNGKGADLINVTKDNKQGVVYYTFPELLSGPLAGKEPITVFVQLERPVEGAELSYNCTPKESQVGMFDVLSVDWQGELDENGKIKNGCEYYARIKIRLTDLCYTKYYLNNETPDRPYINGSVTGWESVSEDGKEGVILKGWISKDKPEEKKEEVKEVVEKVTTDKVPAEIKQTPFTFAGGSGTVTDPYLIQTADQLNSIRFGADKHYKLIADIDLSSWGNWVPIGGTAAYGGTMGDQWNKAHAGSVVFTGSLDGNGHVISGMTIKVHDKAIYMTEGSNVRYYGLFARINSEGTAIKNLGMINHTIDIEYGTIPPSISLSVGSLAALVTKGNIENCYSAGGNISVNVGRAYKMNGASDNKSVEVGGLVGNHTGNFTRCYNTSNIYIKLPEEGFAYGAGIAATVSFAQIRECYNKGNITVEQYFDIEKDGAPSSTNYAAAGIAVKAELADLPGIRGLLPEDTNSFYDCYNTGNLSANGVSGIIHYTGWDVYVYRSYNTGNLTCHSMAANGANHIINKWAAIYTVANPAKYIVGCATEGGSKVSGDAWQQSSSLGRPVLKWNPTEAVSKAVVKNESTVGNFIDVKTNDWFAEPVKWAVEKNVTSGTSSSTFSPDNTCTRAQILTFLWRAVGSPKSGNTNPLKDVNSSDYYYDAALWAYEKGIVSGNTLSPNTPCTRGETVIYLYKSAGSPESDQINQFYDVPASDVSLNTAVCWAFVNNITGGTSYNYFSPNDTCTRGQIVTFLYRAFK